MRALGEEVAGASEARERQDRENLELRRKLQVGVAGAAAVLVEMRPGSGRLSDVPQLFVADSHRAGP